MEDPVVTHVACMFINDLSSQDSCVCSTNNAQCTKRIFLELQNHLMRQDQIAFYRESKKIFKLISILKGIKSTMAQCSI